MRKILTTIMCQSLLFLGLTSQGQNATKLLIQDTRNINPAPAAYSQGLFGEFKRNDSIGAPIGGIYGSLLTIAPWFDASAGKNSQLLFNGLGLYFRQGIPGQATWESWQKIVTASASGNLGIGTINPTSKLDVKGTVTIDTALPAIRLSTAAIDENRYLSILNSGTVTAAGGLKAGGVLISDAYAYANPAKGELVVKSNISIGRATPVSGYRLAVAGKIIAEEVKVKLQSAGWPDYVFKPSYNLMPLKEVAQFISDNGHLPEVPSAKDIEKEGIAVGSNQALLLKKIEELTLYIIEQDKKLEKLSAEVESIRNEKKNK